MDHDYDIYSIYRFFALSFIRTWAYYEEKLTFLDEMEEQEYAVSVERQLRKLTNQQIHFPYLSFIKFNLNYNKSLVVGAKTLTYFSEAKDKYEALLRDISQATDSIHVLYFIIRGDESGEALLQALTKKAREGVKVRLVYDDGGVS